jgi:hypothetical protein
MRLISLAFVAITLLTSGCAGMISGVGTRLLFLTTREEIHAQLGEPTVSGFADGEPFEEYHTRRKISEAGTLRLGDGYAMAWVATLGAIDLICVPHELYLLGRRSLLGQTVRVTYDEAGTITDLRLDGEQYLITGGSSDRHPVEDAAVVPASHDAEPLPLRGPS